MKTMQKIPSASSVLHALFLFFLAITFFNAVQASPQIHLPCDEDLSVQIMEFNGGWKAEIGHIRIVSLSGSPWDIGQQTIHLLVDEMVEIGSYYEAQIPQPDDPVSAFFQNTSMNRQVIPGFYTHIPPEYITELRGVADTEQGPIDEEILFSGVPDIFFNFGCTSIAAWGTATSDGEFYAAKSFDWIGPGITNTLTTLFVYQPENGYSFAHVGFPGLTGPLTGVNEEGLYLSQMWVQLPVDDEQEAMLNLDGLPLQLLLRDVIQYASTIDEALAILKHHPKTVAANLLLAELHTQKAVVVEFTPDIVRVREVEDNNQHLFSTNVFKDPFLQSMYPDMAMYICDRFERLNQILPDSMGTIDEAVMVDVLRDRPLLHDGTIDFFELQDTIANVQNMQSSIVSSNGMIWVADGPQLPASDNRFLGFSLSDLLQDKISPEVLNPPNAYIAHEKYSAFEHYRDALHLLHEGGCTEEAERHLLRASNLLPENSVLEEGLILLVKARVLMEGGHEEAALSTLSASESLISESPDIHPEDRDTFSATLQRIRSQFEDKPGREFATVQHPVLLYSSDDFFPISDFIILGNTETSPDLIELYLPEAMHKGGSIPRDELSEIFALAEMRLMNLGVFSALRIHLVPAEEGYEIIIRISDGKGLYIDPFYAIFGGIGELISGQARIPYYNLAGWSINPYASYRFWDKTVEGGVQTPGYLFPVYHHLSLHADLQFGALPKKGYWDTGATWKLTLIPTIWAQPVTTLSYKERSFTDGSHDETWIEGSLSLPLTFQPSPGTDIHLFGEYGTGTDFKKPGSYTDHFFHRLTSYGMIRYAVGPRLQMDGRGMISTIYGDGPLETQPSLGGTWLRGHRKNELSGTTVQCISFGLGWVFLTDFLTGRTFIDMGRVVDNNTSDLHIDLGVMLDIETPIGPLSISTASTSHEFNPVFHFRFGTEF